MSLVLVVDDDQDQRALLTEMLEEMGHHVVDAPDGAAALELASELKPDLILTDWHMPRLDGLALCQELRRNARLRGTRIILHSTENIPRTCCADACCRKQEDPGLVEALVKTLLPLPQESWLASCH